MAAADAPEREQPAARDAVRLDGLERVLRAARVEAAVPPKEGAQEPPVEMDRQARQALHLTSPVDGHSPARLSNTSRFFACAAAARAVTSTSTAGISCRCIRNDSRIRRRRRFRLTALPATRAATAMPSRAAPASLTAN